MKARLNNDELLRFADSYLRDAFPNPDHVGCPVDEQLRDLAEKPSATKAVLTEHISCCSPCYQRYAELLQEQRVLARQAADLANRRWRIWRTRLIWTSAAFVAVLATIGALIFTRPGPKPLSYSAFNLDLQNLSPSRGGSPESGIPESHVPQAPLALTIQLPVGSEEGPYELSLRSGPNVVWSKVEQSHLANHVVTLKTQIDLRPFPLAKYEFTVESASGLRFVQPVQLVRSMTVSHSGWRDRLMASVASRLISIRLPSASSKATAAPIMSRDVGQLLSQADHLAWLGNWPAASPIYARVELLATQNGDAIATAHARIGRIRGQAESMPFVQVSEMLGAELENPTVQNDPKLRLFALTAKGYTDLDVNLASCRDAWEQALVTARELGDRNWQARATGELGIVAFLEGDRTKAERLVGSALLSTMKNGDVAAQVRLLSMIGNGFTDAKRYDEASEFFGRALKLASETRDIGFPFMAYEGEARCLTALNKPDVAKNVLQKALDEARRLDKRGHEAQILILLGEQSMANNNIPAAEKYLQDAGELSRTSQFRRMETEAMYELATIARNQGRLRDTENYLLRGIDASRAVGDRYYLPRDLSSLAEIKVLQGKPEQADALWDEATDVLEGMLVNAPTASARTTMVAMSSDIYLRHFALAVNRSDVAKAFRIVERARGRSIADLLRSRTERLSTPINTSAERQISTLQIRLIRAESRTQREKLLSDLFEAEQRRAFALTANVRKYSVREPVSLLSLQRVLAPNELVLEYVLSDPDSYCIVVSRAGANLIHLGSTRGRIELLVREYLDEVREKQSADQNGRQLYDVLLAPIGLLRSKTRIIVVPDGVLHLLPFDALQSDAGKYLLDSTVVSYAPSATVLKFLRSNQRSRPPLPFLGVGDVTYDSGPRAVSEASTTRGVYDLAGAHFGLLPGSRSEILTAEQIFGSGSVALLGRSATETAFKHEPLSQFRVLHLAVHGIASPKYPERAALVLGRESDSQDDGLLQEREIANLALNSDLVTLSACDTAVGQLEGQEGIASLQRAFLVAGARATLSTLWAADDTFTAALIKQFYEKSASGVDKGSALREAKLELRQKFGMQATPFYWAGFVLDGDSWSPIISRQ